MILALRESLQKSIGILENSHKNYRSSFQYLTYNKVVDGKDDSCQREDERDNDADLPSHIDILVMFHIVTYRKYKGAVINYHRGGY